MVVAYPADKSTTAPPPMMTPHPQFFLAPSQMLGSGMVPHFPTMPSMYHPTPSFMDGGLHHPEPHSHNALIPASVLSPSDFCPLSQARALVDPLVNPGPRAIPPALPSDSIPTTGSSTGEVPTPKSEAEPPTQAMVGDSQLTHYSHLGSYYYDHEWEVDPALNIGFDPPPTIGF